MTDSPVTKRFDRKNKINRSTIVVKVQPRLCVCEVFSPGWQESSIVPRRLQAYTHASKRLFSGQIEAIVLFSFQHGNSSAATQNTEALSRKEEK